MFNNHGQRKYLTRSETDRFMAAARAQDPEIYSFCWVMAATGCRISEALSLSAGGVDFETNSLTILSLKKRGKMIFRRVPLPLALVQSLRRWIDQGILKKPKLWPWSRMTGYRHIRNTMHAAGICGGHATPKGLRHGFGVNAVQSGVPLNLVQRWLGHADMKITAIYTSAMGPEEREIASRMWRQKPKRKTGDSGKASSAENEDTPR